MSDAGDRSLVARILGGIAALPSGTPTVEPLGGGLTNRNFRVEVGGEAFVLRLGGHGTRELGIDRTREEAAMRIAAELGVGAEVVHADPAADVLVTRWVPGRPLLADDVRRPATLERIAAAVRRIHEGPAFPGVFSPFETVRDYHRRATERGVAFPGAAARALELSDRIEAALGAAEPLAPCHNDLLPANLIDDGDRVRIIDWEYAAMGQAAFDLGNLAVNAALDAAATGHLLALHPAGRSARAQARVALMRIASDLREAFWGFLQLGLSQIAFDFRAYAQSHLDRVLEGAAHPDLARHLDEAASG